MARRFRRKASCARPASTSGRAFRPSVRRVDADDDATDRSEHRRQGDTESAESTPNLRTYQACSYAYRDSDGECSDQPVSSDGGGGGGGVGQEARTTARAATLLQAALNLRTIANEIVAEIDGSLSDAQADELARRHGLARLASQNFPLIGGTIGLFRITDRRSVETVEPRTRHRRRRSLGAAEFPLCAAGPEGGIDRGRSRAIRARETSIARGAYAGPRRQRHHCRDRFRNRRQTSGTRERDCRHLRCARQQGRSACPRHRHCRRDRGACAADGQRAGGEDSGDPRFRRRRRTARKARRS